MAANLGGWRLPLKLAARDLRRYKGRSLLAALLIVLPVFAMAGMLSALRTATVDDAKVRAVTYKTAAASVTFNDMMSGKPESLPAAGRPVGPPNHPQPSAAQVSRQANAPVVEEHDAYLRLAPADGGPSFIPTEEGPFRETDVRSPLVRPSFHLDSGRLPAKPGEVLVSQKGIRHGLPQRGVIQASSSVYDDSTKTHPVSAQLTIVGVFTSIGNMTLLGPTVPALASASTTPTFLIGGREWDTATIAQWQKYGAQVETRSYSQTYPGQGPSVRNNPSMAVPVAIGTMGFIAVTALLAGPAFAASATRQRRTLGLIAANGATRPVLRRIVLAQALLLGVLTAVVSSVLGGILGAFTAKWALMHFSGEFAPIDIPVAWLVGVVVVSSVASLVAAAIPARSAGRTNLLAALRGQVSARVVKRRWPLIGLVGVGLGTLCLLGATAPSATNSNTNNDTRNVLLSYLGVPLFFGGAVLAVPFFLMATGKLARFLPVTARIAVRDVSRQRTRATASVGAVLATVSVLCAASIFGASIDKREREFYQPSYKIGSGAFTAVDQTRGPSPSQDQDIAKIRKLLPQATPLWTVMSDVGVPRLTAGVCRDNSHAGDAYSGSIVIGMRADDISRAGFAAKERETLERGGALVLTSGIEHGPWMGATDPVPVVNEAGRLTLRDQDPSMSTNDLVQKGCKPWTLSAMTMAKPPSHLTSLPRGAVLVDEELLRAKRLPSALQMISLDPDEPISAQKEHQLAAATPPNMNLTVEHGYPRNVLTWALAGLTAGFALIILLTTIVSTLLNDAESRADMATLAAAGAPRGMRRRIVGAHAAAIGFIGAVGGIAVGFIPGLILARVGTSGHYESGHPLSGTYAIAWWPLLAVLVLVPLVAALISMVFARRAPSLTRREA